MEGTPSATQTESQAAHIVAYVVFAILALPMLPSFQLFVDFSTSAYQMLDRINATWPKMTNALTRSVKVCPRRPASMLVGPILKSD